MHYTRELREGVNIILSPFTRKDMDAPGYLQAFHDPEITKYNSHGLFPYTKAKQEEFAQSIEKQNDTMYPDKLIWAIYLDDYQNQLIKNHAHYVHIPVGNCTLQKINYIYRSAEFAIVIWAKQFWGAGIAHMVLNLVLFHAFNRLGLHRVWSGTADTNIAMKKVLINCGFQQEGVFKDGMFLNGDFVDVPFYGIIRKDPFYKIRKEGK